MISSPNRLVPVPSFPGYFADMDGRVWSNRPSFRNPCGLSVITLATTSNKYGYEIVCPVVGGRPRNTPVHHMVTEAFLGPRPAGLQVAHLNGVRTDNRAANLAYVTAAENAAHRIIHGTEMIGEKNPRATLSDDRWRELLRRFERGEKGRALAREYGVHPATISSVRSGRYRRSLCLTNPASGKEGQGAI